MALQASSNSSPKIRTRFCLLLCAALLALLTFAPASYATTAMQAYVDAMQPGTNLGNTLDAVPNETAWGNPLTTQALIQQIAAQGFKSIRIPVTWRDHVGPAPTYTIDPTWMARVRQIVDWSLQSGMYVMINMHHDSALWVNTMPTNHDAVLAEFRAIWTQIANEFIDEPNTLMFESLNEPQFDNVSAATGMTLVDELNTNFYNIVRGSGGLNVTRPLVLPPYNTSAAQANLDSLRATMTKLNDPYLIATVHYYGFWPFSVNISGYTKFESTSMNDIVSALTNVHNTMGVNGIPTIVGEYGLLGYGTPNANEHGELLKYFEFFLQEAHAEGVTHMLWDDGSFFDRRNNRWRDPDIYAVVKQGVTGRSTTADTDLVFLKAGAQVPDAVLHVSLNGNTFVSLTDGTTTLTSGTDYTFDGSILTVKASALAKYATGSFGEKTVLTINADSGPGWKIHVRYCDTPVLSTASGTTNNSLWIPVSFNGDMVSTMESVYSNGGSAGPAGWTPYQQFGDSFSPDYTNGGITMSSKYLAAISGSSVNLTFHFWSGRTVKYQLAFSGSNVTGKQTTGTLPVFTIQPRSIGVVLGSSATLISSATGATSYQWTKDGIAIQGATSASYTISSVQASDIGVYAVSASGASGSEAPSPVSLTLAPAITDKLTGISTRAYVGPGDSVMVAGFTIAGTQPKTVLIRASGPALAQYLPAGTVTLPDPVVTLFDLSNPSTPVQIARNDNWDSSTSSGIADAAKRANEFPWTAGSKDAALLITLYPGTYTAQVSDSGTGTGVALVEVYDVDTTATASKIVDISTRAYVKAGTQKEVAGFAITGSNPKRLLIRAAGPALSAYITGTLPDPMFTLFDLNSSTPTSIDQNDNWASNQTYRDAFSATGEFPFPDGSKDAALIKTLNPGLYSAEASDTNAGEGIAIVEVYEYP